LGRPFLFDDIKPEGRIAAVKNLDMAMAVKAVSCVAGNGDNAGDLGGIGLERRHKSAKRMAMSAGMDGDENGGLGVWID